VPRPEGVDLLAGVFGCAFGTYFFFFFGVAAIFGGVAFGFIFVSSQTHYYSHSK
jgi:hypothetical protein